MTVLWSWKEVYQINDAFFTNVSGLQNIGRREVLLLGCVGLILWRGNAEVASLIFVQESAEDGRRVEVGPTKLSAICKDIQSIG
jgi:hypothetical protein